jgi:hypothetical protein
VTLLLNIARDTSIPDGSLSFGGDLFDWNTTSAAASSSPRPSTTNSAPTTAAPSITTAAAPTVTATAAPMSTQTHSQSTASIATSTPSTTAAMSPAVAEDDLAELIRRGVVRLIVLEHDLYQSYPSCFVKANPQATLPPVVFTTTIAPITSQTAPATTAPMTTAAPAAVSFPLPPLSVQLYGSNTVYRNIYDIAANNTISIAQPLPSGCDPVLGSPTTAVWVYNQALNALTNVSFIVATFLAPHPVPNFDALAFIAYFNGTSAPGTATDPNAEMYSLELALMAHVVVRNQLKQQYGSSCFVTNALDPNEPVPTPASVSTRVFVATVIPTVFNDKTFTTQLQSYLSALGILEANITVVVANRTSLSITINPTSATADLVASALASMTPAEQSALGIANLAAPATSPPRTPKPSDQDKPLWIIAVVVGVVAVIIVVLLVLSRRKSHGSSSINAFDAELRTDADSEYARHYV